MSDATSNSVPTFEVVAVQDDAALSIEHAQEFTVSTPSRHLTPAGETAVRELSRRHRVSEGATLHLIEALLRSGGHMAQFDHPELGGNGQWMRGGMIMLSDMGNHALKAKVGALCEDIAQRLEDAGNITPAQAQVQSQSQSRQQHPTQPGNTPRGAPDTSLFVPGTGRGANWWPASLSTPASSGSQNHVRYAWFPTERRLAIDTGGRVTVYDSGDHRIQGVSQQQAGDSSLTFTSQRGVVRVAELREATDDDSPAATPGPERHSTPANVDSTRSARADDPLTLIARLAELKDKGILSDAEFAAKKAELLGRI